MTPVNRHYPLLFLAAAFAMAAARAWTCDDAFITFRVVDQWLSGNGPVFNLGERVQVFTHPLWMLVLAAWHGLGGSLFPGAMVLSLAFYAAALAFLYAGFSDKPLALAVAFTSFLLCRAVSDFATGGLETPLTFALFAAAVWAMRRQADVAAVALLALLPLVRLDLALWILPLAVVLLARVKEGRRVAVAAALALPAFGWAVFSTIYYGAPLPNTAQAKLGAELPARLDSGLGYVAASFANDPGAFALLIAAALIAAVQWRRGNLDRGDRDLALACSASAVLGIGYAVWTGGDFMLGRFILPALWALGMLMLVSFPPAVEKRAGRRAAAATLAILAAFHLLTGQSANNLWLGLEEKSLLRAVGFAGATDERRVYIPWLGAYAANRLVARTDESPPTQRPRIVAMLGQNGFLARREQPVADILGLADPFVARLAPLPNGRPGHAYRPLPPDFDRWRDPGHRFGDARLDALAQDLRMAHRSTSLFTTERFAAVARLLTLGPIPGDALVVAEEESEWRIELKPARLYRPGPAAKYAVWIRRYDPGHIGYFSEFPRGLDAHCRPVDMPPERRNEPALEVPAGEAVLLRCAKRDVGSDGILVRIGARVAGDAIAYDEIIPVVRPFLGWTSGFAEWLVEGWDEKPRPAVAVALCLLLAAALLWRSAEL